MSINKCNNCHESSCTDNNFHKSLRLRVETRTEFSIVENQETITVLLQYIAKENINIDGLSLQTISPYKILFTFAIGTSQCQSSIDLAVVRCIFNKLCINYHENQTLYVLYVDDVPEMIATIYSALSNNNISISSSYFGSNNSLYIDTNCNKKAKCIIANL